MDQNKFEIDFYGQKDEIEINIITTDRTEVPPPVEFEKDSNLKFGDIEIVQKGSPGYRISSWRVYYQEGIEIKRAKLFDDYYNPKPYIYRVSPNG